MFKISSNNIILLISLILTLFIVHWIFIRKYKSTEKRLEKSRYLYLFFSLLITTFALLSYKNTGICIPYIFLITGYILSSVGDLFNLQFAPIRNRVKYPLAAGIFSFMAAQTSYIIFFISVISPSRLFGFWWFYLFLFISLAGSALIFKFRVYSRKRPKIIMLGALIYGFFLMTMLSVVLSGAILNGKNWWFILGGALSFLLSDAIMGETTIKGHHPAYEYQVPWITYLIAQGFILFGFVIQL